MVKSKLEITIIVIATLSMLSSLFVIVTFFTFQSMREKRFMKFIFYISLSDFLFNISTSFGFPSNPSVCFAQAAISNIFSISSWLWTAALSYTMYCIIHGLKTVPDIYWHLFCWLIPAFNAFVQLHEGTFGAPSPKDTWCSFIPYSTTSIVVVDVITYGLFWCWFFLSMFVMIACGFSVHRKLFFDPASQTKDLVRRMYSKIALYPVFMVLCWATNYIVTGRIGSDSNTEAFVGMVAGSSNGIITAAIFFINSEEARARWQDLLFPGTRDSIVSDSAVSAPMPIDFENDSKYNESFADANTLLISVRDDNYSYRESSIVRPSESLVGGIGLMGVHPMSVAINNKQGAVEAEPRERL